jgi:uncharacterized Zn-finger protein
MRIMAHDRPRHLVPPPPEVVYTSSKRVSCDGDEGPLGHPLTWYTMGPEGYVECRYCDRRFVYDEAAPKQ